MRKLTLASIILIGCLAGKAYPMTDIAINQLKKFPTATQAQRTEIAFIIGNIAPQLDKNRLVPQLAECLATTPNQLELFLVISKLDFDAQQLKTIIETALQKASDKKEQAQKLIIIATVLKNKAEFQLLALSTALTLLKKDLWDPKETDNLLTWIKTQIAGRGIHATENIRALLDEFNDLLMQRERLNRHARERSLAILINKGGIDGEYKKANNGEAGALLGTLVDLINQGIPTITSPSLMHDLGLLAAKNSARASAFTALQNPDQWAVFLNSRYDYALLLPITHSYDGLTNVELLQRYGFKATAGIKINNIAQTFTSPLFREAFPIDLNNIIAMFNTRSPKKHIYIVGHGAPGIIAQVRTAQFGTFLGKLDPYADFCYISSCFAGGTNMSTLSKILQEPATVAEITNAINYPMIIEGTADTSTIYKGGGYTYFIRYFERLDHFLRGPHRRLYLANPMTRNHASNILLKDVLCPLFNQFNTGVNVQLIRFPGQKSNFRIVHQQGGDFARGNELAITNVNIQAHRVRTKADQHSMRPWAVDGTNRIYAYVTDMSDIHFIHGNQDPLYVSMITGASQHIIGFINTTQPSLRQFIFTSFLQPLHHNGQSKEFDRSAKAWFIKKLVLGNGRTVEGVIIYKRNEKLGHMIEIAFKEGTHYCRLETANNKLPTLETLTTADLHAVETTASFYEYLAYLVFQETHPQVDDLHYATSGNEVRRNYLGAFKSFAQYVGIDLGRYFAEDKHEFCVLKKEPALCIKNTADYDLDITYTAQDGSKKTDRIERHSNKELTLAIQNIKSIDSITPISGKWAIPGFGWIASKPSVIFTGHSLGQLKETSKPASFNIYNSTGRFIVNGVAAA